MLSSSDQRSSLNSMTCIALMLAVLASAAQAHIAISPTQSKLGMKETYTLTVPTEGTSVTTAIELEIPQEVTIISVNAPVTDYAFTKADNRITGITWRVNIPPGASTQLVFVAQNPVGVTRGIRWKVHQLFADGSRADWVDPPPARPAPLTRLSE